MNITQNTAIILSYKMVFERLARFIGLPIYFILVYGPNENKYIIFVL